MRVLYREESATIAATGQVPHSSCGDAVGVCRCSLFPGSPPFTAIPRMRIAWRTGRSGKPIRRGSDQVLSLSANSAFSASSGFSASSASLANSASLADFASLANFISAAFRLGASTVPSNL